MYEINNSEKVFNIVKPVYNPLVEEFWGLFLNSKLNLINKELLARGSLNYCPVHPRDIFREAVKSNCYAIILAHNHPSNDPQPSESDIRLTKKLLAAAKIVEIPILDHIVFTENNYVSLREKKLIRWV